MPDYSCPKCGKVLKSKTGLNGHLMLAHGGANATQSDTPEASVSEKLTAIKASHDALQERVDSLSRDVAALGKFSDSVIGGKDMDGVLTSKDMEIHELKEQLEKTRAQVGARDKMAERRKHAETCPDCHADLVEHNTLVVKQYERTMTVPELANLAGEKGFIIIKKPAD